MLLAFGAMLLFAAFLLMAQFATWLVIYLLARGAGRGLYESGLGAYAYDVLILLQFRPRAGQ